MRCLLPPLTTLLRCAHESVLHCTFMALMQEHAVPTNLRSPPSVFIGHMKEIRDRVLSLDKAGRSGDIQKQAATHMSKLARGDIRVVPELGSPHSLRLP